MAPAAEELAERIIGPGRYKFDELVEGIRLEQKRLRTGSHLVVLWQQVLDFEGLTDWLYLGDAFDDVPAARRRATQQLNDLRIAQTSVPATSGRSWHVDPTRDGHFLPKVQPREPLLVEDEQRIALTGSPYDRVYFCTRVLGPFPGAIVGHELIDVLAETRFDLWSFLVDVAEAHRKAQPQRTPMQISGG